MLVADDDEIIRGLVAAILGDAGYRVALASDGEEALRVAGELKPTLVILDFNMPRLDGFEVTRRIRASETIGGTPVIVMSAAGEQSDAKAAEEAGADAYLVKPFGVDELLEAVATLLRHA